MLEQRQKNMSVASDRLKDLGGFKRFRFGIVRSGSIAKPCITRNSSVPVMLRRGPKRRLTEKMANCRTNPRRTG